MAQAIADRNKMIDLIKKNYKLFGDSLTLALPDFGASLEDIADTGGSSLKEEDIPPKLTVDQVAAICYTFGGRQLKYVYDTLKNEIRCNLLSQRTMIEEAKRKAMQDDVKITQRIKSLDAGETVVLGDREIDASAGSVDHETPPEEENEEEGEGEDVDPEEEQEAEGEDDVDPEEEAEAEGDESMEMDGEGDEPDVSS